MTHQPVSQIQRHNAREMRKSMTDAELKLWNCLRAHRLMGLGFRRQLPISSYIVDFACPEHKLIIEVDGSGHNDDKQIEYDERRTTFLQSQGWCVIRLWNNEVLDNIENACAHIIAVLQERGVKFDD